MKLITNDIVDNSVIKQLSFDVGFKMLFIPLRQAELLIGHQVREEV